MLPPIIEMSSTKDKPQIKSPTSPVKSPELTVSKLSPENPFRTARRTSVSSLSKSPPPVPAARRLSKSLNKSDLQNGFNPTARRDSAAGLFNLGRKASFGTVGSKITALIKAKNAFNGLKGRRKSKDCGDIEIDVNLVEIKELPKEPRFASTLSAEAQYAMMKGYEDVVYRNMCTQFPDTAHLLRRNKTPVTGIIVKTTDQTDSIPSNAMELHTKADSDFIEQVTSANRPRKSVTSNGSISSSTSEQEQRTPGRVTPQSVSRAMTPSMPATGEVVPINKLGRSETCQTLYLPKIQVKEKQKLVMTHRYQSAMDFLDMLREQQGLHRLSPRVKTLTEGEPPVRVYNAWSYVWSREFEPARQGSEFGKRDGMRNH